MSRSNQHQPGNPRACVLEALLEWENSAVYASEIFASLTDSKFKLSPLDQALARELFFGILRNLSWLDQIVAKLRSKGKTKITAQCLLRLGLYQIFKTKIADHAAVNETVSLARKHERGLVNAILRNALRQRTNIETELEKCSIADRFSHPDFLVQRWTADHGEKAAQQMCQWNNTPASVYARIHDEELYQQILTRIGSTQQGTVSDSTGYNPVPVDEFPEFVELPPGPVPKQLIESGAIYIQDPSTSVAPWLLAPMPDETILDACAAPGGKTAMLAAMAPAGCKIIASDSSLKRIERLDENLQRLQVKNVDVKHIDWSTPASGSIRDLPKFDAILLDVPCSNTGVMRRRVDVRWRLRPNDFAQFAAQQTKILKNAIAHLKPGGRIIYSTCSIDPEENLQLVESTGLKIKQSKQCLPWKDGVDGCYAVWLEIGDANR